MDCPAPTFTSVVPAIFQRLGADPARCVVRFRGESISGGALLYKAAALADSLGAVGIVHGTRVGVCMDRSPDILVVLLALWLRRAVYVPLDAALPRQRLFAMCETADLELLITQPDLQESASKLPVSLLVLEPITFPDAPIVVSAFATGNPAACDDAYILFTSGSSGIPKAVRITHGNLATLFAAILPLLHLPEGCMVLGCANVGFDIAFFELLAPLLCGGTLVLADASTCAAPAALLALVEREGVTVMQATPSHWQLLTALPWTSRVHIALATGEALSRVTAAGVLQHADVLWNLYGPTECTIWSSAHRVGDSDLDAAAPAAVSIGRALPGYSLRVAHTSDTTGAGELIIGGPAVSPGYCAAPVTVTPFRSGAGVTEQRVYHSGDLCYADARGLLHCIGRRDNQAKHNGYRIELDEIALLLEQHMSIRQAVCCIRPASAASPSLLFACVVFRPGLPNRNKRALNAHLATQLPAWMLPQRYFFLEQLPLTANGKLDRGALLALTDPAPVPAPAGNLQSQVSSIFCEVLDLDSIGPCDSFLDAGGTSMLAATLVLTLNARLGANLTLRQALEQPPTVAGITQLLRNASAASASA